VASAVDRELPVKVRFFAGTPVHALLYHAQAAALLVLGRHVHTGHRDVRGHSVAMPVLARADAPVLIEGGCAGGTRHRRPAPVVAAVGPDDGDAVLEFAFVEAAERGVPLQVTRIWCADMLPDEEPRTQRRDRADRQLAEAVAPWADRYPEVPVVRRLRYSPDVAVGLVAAGGSAGLLVVGAHHGPELNRLPAGSVAHALVHTAPCPVVVVPVG
jgi:nucleotide-binding universal stress UspA family protein